MKNLLEKFRSKSTSSVKVTESEEVLNSDTCNTAVEVTDEKFDITDIGVNESSRAVTEEIIPIQQPKRKVICISKMGSDHNFQNKNNQDFSFNLLNMKIVMDGCGSGKHSEVGVRLFGQLFARKAKEYFDKGESINEENFIDVVNSIFYKMLDFCDDTSFIFQNFCFTILVCFELEDEFVVYSCGDGYIIKENEEGISFDYLDDGEYPCYYIYNYITDKSALVQYKEGASFKVTRFAKQDYFNVGVASDGLRFCENLLDVEKAKMMKFLREGKGPQIEVLINRNNRKNEMFHDDISICF